jgi:glycosyltransferase involved in cell wall biosynthesis
MGKPLTRIKLTYEEYRNAGQSERERYELLEGEILMVPSLNEHRQRILGDLEFILRGFVKQHDLRFVTTVPPGDPDALAAGIKRLLAEAVLRRSMGHVAEQKARYYDVKRMVGRTLEVYDKVLGSTTPCRLR